MRHQQIVCIPLLLGLENAMGMLVMQMRHHIFSASQKFDHSASNVIQHVPQEIPKSEDFEGTNNKKEGYDGDQFIQQFNNIENNKNLGRCGDYEQSLNDWDDNFPPSEDFQGIDEYFQGTNEYDE